MSENPPKRREARVAPAPPAALLLSAIVDSSDDAILSTELDGTITSWNQAAEKMLGYAPGEIIGQSCLMLATDDQQAAEREVLRRVAAGARVEHFEANWVCKGGRLVEVSVTISPVRSAEGTIIGTSKVARDITERKRGNRADHLLAAIVNSSDDAIVSKNLDGIVTTWNAGAERVFGYMAEEMIGQPVLKLVPKDRKEEEPRILDRLRRGERVDHFQTVRVRKNGEPIDVSLTISPVRDATGKVIGASKIARDISDLKRAAQERDKLLESERTARSQAEHANRMKDEFLATISHELRTPLNAILGWTEVLKGSMDNPAEVADGIAVIERNAHAQAQLIDDLLDLGRISSGKMALNVEPIDVGAIVGEAVISVQHAADTKRIVIKTILNDVQDRMMGDVKRLRQVIWNLLTNAIKFTPPGGQVTVDVSSDGTHALVSVTDTGRGIVGSLLPFVFDRFKQGEDGSSPLRTGLGLGLTLAREMVHAHQGTIVAASPGEGLGATFTIRLPLLLANDDTRGTFDRSRMDESTRSDHLTPAAR
jgi:PAS domain S-box-containing protein